MSNPSFPKGHVTFLHTVYHQVLSESPTSVDPRGNYPIFSDEQPFVRTMKLATEWTVLDSGWLTDVSLVLIENVRELKFSERPGEFALVNPSLRDKRAQAELVAQVGFSLVAPTAQAVPQGPRDMHSPKRPAPAQPVTSIHPCISVKPGRVCSFEPVSPGTVYIRGTAPGVKVKISLFPV